MKDLIKIFLITATVFILSGCDRNVSYLNSGDGFNKKYYAVVVVDGCQYLESYHSLSHKGNCTNIIHNQVVYIPK